VNWIPSMYLIGKDGNVILGTVLSDKVEKTLTELTAVKKVIPGTTEKLTVDGSMGKLAAIIQKPVLVAGQRCPMVMILHGFMGNKGGQLNELIADSLQKHGIASIRFDFNGHGESEGDFAKMTVLNEIEDAKKVYDYVAALPYVNSVAVTGHSQGGVVASMLAGELGSDKLKAVVLMAPAAVLREDAIKGNVFGKSFDPLDPPEAVDMFGGKKLGGDYIRTAFSLPIYETAAKYDGPALIVHGTGDRIVPYTYGERYHQIWKNSELQILDGFDHGFSQNIYRADAIVSNYLIKELCK
jgi:pimeloyl-ACP methyl ester carboxylesterase